VNIQKAALLKKAMNGKRQRIPDPKDRTKGITAWSQMRDLTQKFHTMAFFLKRIAGRVSRTIHMDVMGLQLDALSFAWGGNEFTCDPDARTRSGLVQRIV
jgi:hypothetical protein